MKAKEVEIRQRSKKLQMQGALQIIIPRRKARLFYEGVKKLSSFITTTPN